MVTVYNAPLAYWVANVWVGEEEVSERESPRLSCSFNVPVRPVAETLIGYVVVVEDEHETEIVTFEVMVPLALLPAVQVSLVGWETSVTVYETPLAY